MEETNKNSLILPVEDPLADLAIERTELALERTHLAWIRTVIGLITSGFAIDQLVEAFRQKKAIAGEEDIARDAHMTGLVLTISGTLLMVITTYYYQKRRKELLKQRHARRSNFPPGIVLSVMIFIVGLVLVYMVATSR